jgi:hypothetical protein
METPEFDYHPRQVNAVRVTGEEESPDEAVRETKWNRVAIAAAK